MVNGRVAGTPGCGAGSQPVPITWGGPLCTFRSDNIESYDVKNASIRSINPSKKLVRNVANVGYSRSRKRVARDDNDWQRSDIKKIKTHWTCRV